MSGVDPSSPRPPVGADSIPDFNIGDSAYLTPDTLLAYCQARMNDIDSQIKSGIAQQNQDNYEEQVINEILQAFDPSTGGIGAVGNPDSGDCQDLIDKVTTELGKLPPGSDAHNRVAQLLADLTKTAGDGIISDKEMQGYVDTLKGIQSDLNSGAELNMIALQSLMSQRETAIQLTTNMVQSLGDQLNKIAANIGH